MLEAGNQKLKKWMVLQSVIYFLTNALHLDFILLQCWIRRSSLCFWATCACCLRIWVQSIYTRPLKMWHFKWEHFYHRLLAQEIDKVKVYLTITTLSELILWYKVTACACLNYSLNFKMPYIIFRCMCHPKMISGLTLATPLNVSPPLGSSTP